MYKSGKIGLVVEYNPDKVLLFSADINKWAEFYWHEKLRLAHERSVLLFNGPLFYVSGVTIDKNIVSINLINTDYRSYVCSRSKEFKELFPTAVPSKPLAACVALITSDNKLLLEKRRGVDVHEGMYHVVGGFLDPSKDIDLNGKPDAYYSVTREVKEEIGISVSPDKLVFLGIAEDTIIPHFELCFYSILPYKSDQILKLFNESDKDGEFSDPVFIDISEEIIKYFFSNSMISPTGKVCIERMLTIVNKSKYNQ